MPEVTLDGSHVWMTVPEGSVAAEAKSLGYAHLRGGRLRYGVESAPQVVAFADKHGYQVDPRARTRAAEIQASPDVNIVGKVIHVLHDKSKHLPNLVDAIPTAVHRTSKSHNYWSVPLPESAKVVAWADEHGLVVSAAVREDAGTRWMTELQAFNFSSAVESVEAPEISGLTSALEPIQIPPIVALQQTGKLLLADVPGLGKTLETLAAARIKGRERKRLVIICPSNLAPTWAAEMSKHFEGDCFSPLVATGREPKQIPEGVDTVVVGWAVIDAWEAELATWKPDGLIVDEGQYAKGGKKRTRVVDKPKRNARGQLVYAKEEQSLGGSARATGALDLAKAVRGRKDTMVVVTTGTPMVNRPLELLALLEILGIDHVFGGPVAYKNRYCGPKEVEVPGRWGGKKVEYKGATHLRELNTRLRSSGFYMRRTKEDWVASGRLKRKIVDGVFFYDRAARRRPVILNAPDHALIEYREAEQAQAEYFVGYAREVAAKSGIGMQSQAMAAKVAAKGASELTRIGELRQIAARIKMPAIMSRVQDLIDAGEKVVIAAHHKDIVDAYADRFGGLKIQGGMSPAKVEEQKLLFNSTPVTEYPVIVLSVEACKAGHTLCLQEDFGVGPACANMIFAEQIWVAGDEEQVQDRIWRFGQPREVHIQNVLLAGTVDMVVYQVRENKRRNLDAAIDGIGKAGESAAERSGAGQVAVGLFQMASSGGGAR